jgi:hypothetical protein
MYAIGAFVQWIHAAAMENGSPEQSGKPFDF